MQDGLVLPDMESKVSTKYGIEKRQLERNREEKRRKVEKNKFNF